MTAFRNWPACCALIVAALAALAATASCGAESAPTVASPSASAAVQAGVALTLRQHTAAVVITGTENVGGMDVRSSGSGQADFTDTGFAGVIDSTLPSMTVRQQLLALDGDAYLRLGIVGVDIVPLTSGREWASMSTYPGNTYTFGAGNPLPQLHLLTASGNTVRSLGTSTIDGVKTAGYSVSVATATLVHELQQQLTRPGLMLAEQKQIRKALAHPEKRSLTVRVWFDESGLLRRMIAPSMWGGTPATAATLTLTFTHYGTPVHITAPAARDVVSYAQFVRAEEQLRPHHRK